MTKPKPPHPPRECLECGDPFTPPPKQPNATFCCAAHKVRWQNRRLMRGLELYDFVMAKRYDRKNEKEARGLIDRVTAAYRDSDKAHRAGRRSWLKFDEAKHKIPLGYSTGGDNR